MRCGNIGLKSGSGPAHLFQEPGGTRDRVHLELWQVVEPDVPTPVPLPRTEVERAVYAALVLAGESR